MKKLITILVVLGIVSAVGTVVACATDEAETVTTETQTNENTTEGNANDIITTENMETTSATLESTMPENTEDNKEAVDGDTENGMGTETDAEEVTEVFETDETTDNAEVIESESEPDTDVKENEDISIPQTGDKRKILPVIATLIVSGITAAYCVVKGKKTKKTKADGE